MIELWKSFRLRMDALLHRHRYEEELSEEFEFHIEQEALENEKAGMTPEAARRAALIAFGGVEYQKERLRDQRGARWLDDLVQDSSHAFRSLRRSPQVTVVVTLTLALGIGLNSAMFSVVDHVLLRPAPYPRSDDLVLVFGTSPTSLDRLGTSWADFWDLREQVGSFSQMAVFETGTETPVVVPGGQPAILGEGAVGVGFLDVLGLRPALGRAFTRDEHVDRAPVIMITYALWQDRFGGDPDILTRSIELGGETRAIVGVLPERLGYPEHADFVSPDVEAPPRPEDEADGFGRGWRAFMVVARLADDVPLEIAQADLDRLAKSLQTAHPASNEGHEFLAVPLVGDATLAYRSAILSVWAAVALILMVACVNVANLLFSRGLRRRKEIAIRLTLGGGRGRIVRQLLAESLLFSVIGALIGLGFGWMALELFLGLVPAPIPGLDRITLDWRVASAMTALTLLAGSLSGLAPALRSSRVNLDQAMRAEGRAGTESREARRLQSALVVGQIGLSTVLLLAAGLFLASFQRIARVDPGFGTPERVLSVRISVQPPKYEAWEGFRNFFARVERELESIPGVEASALSFTNPMEPDHAFQIGFEVEGVIETENEADRPLAALWPVSSGFFRTIDLPLTRGRPFTMADRKDAPGVVIVNEAFVQRYLPNIDPLGLSLRKTQFWADGYPAVHEIVGVAADMKTDGLKSPAYPVMFFPYDQTPFGNMRVLVRAREDVMEVAAGLRSAVWRVDSDIPMERLQPLDLAIGQSLAGDRFAASIATLFATIALGLSAVGLFGVMSNAVGARVREFGIRRALGAQRRGIMRAVLGEAFRTSMLGWLLGLVGFLLVSPVIKGALFATEPTDPTTWASVGIVLVVTALAAASLPARRASNVAPAVALRGSAGPADAPRRA